jgi:hypothetical protein
VQSVYIKKGKIFSQATRVVDQHADGDRVAAFSRYHSWQVVSDGGVEPDLTALGLLKLRILVQDGPDRCMCRYGR